MSFANTPNPIGVNASFTALSEPYNNSSSDIILNQMH